jgi:hypothetical protein
MKFTNIKDLKYSSADNSTVDLLATCKEYSEIPMTLNLIDTEDLHTFASGIFETVMENGKTVKKEILTPLEAYCKTLAIAAYVAPVEAVITPTSISRRQARRYLLSIDKLDEVETFIATDRLYQIEYEADTFERSNLMIPIIQELLELTDSQVDNMFIEASKL